MAEEDVLRELRDLRKETTDVRERVIKLEVGIGILRWLFAALVTMMGVAAAVAGVLISYLNAGGG